ncbi:hypothetical protein SLEP1_g2106 [Rubroshorea leprosula]|uniref:Hpc2-related domain-containing protein n=1 Tax=Rubroshorea leprosula TaxID=152421 RepID=A0AAV5HML7_9ROSI|nr:hypothetical protein SLEP1_g2106 [Rubroshorea leprosula]
MAEEKSGGGGSSGVVSPKMMKAGDRQVVRVELRPGETTYVSWRKLMKAAERVNGSSASPSASVSAPAPDPVPNAHPNLQSRIIPGQPAEEEVKDEPRPNRFSAVIEKIEHLYMGKDSSDEEELDNIPDDDQYDTEDSFIDDRELDEYFEVDNSAIKHDGFFVNRGKLERMNEPVEVPNQQPKKRRRKDMAKTHGESAEDCASNKHIKTSKMPAANTEASLGKNPSSPFQNMNVIDEPYRDVKGQNQLGVSGIISRKKSSDKEMMTDPSPYLKVLNGDASASMADVKEVEKSRTGVLLSKNIATNKCKDTGGSSEALHQKYSDKNAYSQPKLQHGKPLSNIEQLEPLVGTREKNGICELGDINVSEGKYVMQTTNTSHMPRKDGSTIRPKGSMLEKAIGELEKMVAESRPPAVDIQEADTTAQGVKRRLPREIKMKLAKVARLALASQGKVSKELINRLMSILGHLIQLRTLKLAELWPNGLMDNHGIKRAICRAKEQQRASIYTHESVEKIRRKKMLTGRLYENVQVEARTGTESSSLALTSSSKPIPSPSTTVATVQMPSPSTNGYSLDRLKQEKLKGSSSNAMDETRMADGSLTKKKVKKKPELELEETHFRPEKLPAQLIEGSHKSMKTSVSHT